MDINDLHDAGSPTTVIQKPLGHAFKSVRFSMAGRMDTNGDFSDRNTDGAENDFSFISPEKAEELFKDIPEALKNTLKIAEMCNLELKLGSWVFPDFKVESGLTSDEELRRIAYLGFAKRNLPQTKEYTDRLDYELKVILD